MKNLMICTKYYTLNIINKKNEMGRACGMYADRRGAHRVLVGKPEGKRPLGRPRRRWENNLKWIF